MGMNKDLGLKGNEFSNVATFLFVGLLCFEVPNSECQVLPRGQAINEIKSTFCRFFPLPSGLVPMSSYGALLPPVVPPLTTTPHSSYRESFSVSSRPPSVLP
jgi:hypothetical protein